MDQIRENQIIPSRQLEQNPDVAPPKDFYLNVMEPQVVSSPQSTNNSPNIDQGLTGNNYGDQFNDSVQLPATPAIISIKEQIVNIHEDGTASIDVILIVQDITNITEYDLRVAKDAGNL